MSLQCFCSSQSPVTNPSFEGPCEFHTLEYQTTRTKCSTAEISDINKLRMEEADTASSNHLDQRACITTIE